MNKPIFLTREKTYIKDIIHDSIELSLIAKTIIDTPIFQRLRYLHQVGVCYLIFPNTNHTRFEHSIGTYHLAGLFIDKLIKNSTHIEINKAIIQIKFIREYLLRHLELDETEENISFLEKIDIVLLDDYLIELIKIAGLIHDLGHGPFSHLFDEWLNSIPEIKHSNILEHESRSIVLLKQIIDNEKIIFCEETYYMKEFITDEAFEFISELINPMDDNFKNNFIFQLISNKDNGLDVDKLDYLYRDSFYFGLGKPYDLSQVILHARVIKGNICFPEDNPIAYNIYKIYRSRYDLHKQYYAHKTICCIEYMIRDILYHLDPILQITENIKKNNINKFIELNDYVILNTTKILKYYNNIYDMYSTQINSIQTIIERIDERKLYKCIYAESFYTNESISDEDLIDKIKNDYINENIENNDLIFIKLKIGLLSGNNSHPLDTIHFYNNKNMSILLDKTKISHLMPFLHQEIIHYIIKR